MAALVRTCAIVATVFVALSLGAFAIDEFSDGSRGQVAELEGSRHTASRAELSRPAPSAAVERARERVHSGPRELIDDVDDLLLTPFTGLADNPSVWASRLLPGVLALLLYGLGGLTLANALPQPRREVRDWREA